jgi:ammonium transporter Rh
MTKYARHLVVFAVILVVLELLMMFMYGFFVRYTVVGITTGYLESFYPWFQDVNVMILIGFGFLMSFIRSKAWSALGFTFFINAIVFQMYILWQGLWYKVFHTGFGVESYIRFDTVVLIKAAFCVGAVLIAFGAMIGRIGPLELLILGIVMTVGYSLN